MNPIKNWQEEKRSAYFYHLIANYESHPLRKKLFENLALAAEEQAAIWARQVKTPLSFQLSVRDRLVSYLLMQFGPERLRYVLSAMKVRGMSIFNTLNHEHKHRWLSMSGNLRAAVFGVNDGLVSNMSLLLGMVGAHAQHPTIIIAGIAGLLAGACSMAAGEFVSVRSQREVLEYQIGLERSELELYPEEEIQELTLIYQARGLVKEEAEKLSRLLINNPETALDTLAREELGLNPAELPSPMGAMLSSFLTFAMGALIPVIPFLVGDYVGNLSISMGLTALSLLAVGALLSLFTNTSALLSSIRMLCIGAAAGGITYGIGRLMSVVLT
ncbi:MAG: hypothetical protein A3E83_03600 [Gammaproteobacteria bacterium RIFCSPHIGHO2_12_FULL_41_20]|nr:MAG: hypothetical protein A3E83_03600 [Gammaproteobacteria bacterium RIFCSPHIGHO2_12_FULL_41_20]